MTHTARRPFDLSTARRLLAGAFALLLVAVPARADFFENIYDGLFGPSEEETAPARTDMPTAAGAATTKTSSDDEAGHEPYRQTLSDARLADIVERQEELFAEMEVDSARRGELEYGRRLRAIATEYDSFLLDNPDYVYGYLLYGKFLRRAGENKRANDAFMRANMLDPNLAVAKQQIGNYLTEEGEYGLALPYYLAAIDLEPEVPVYRYELGELLSRYRSNFIASGKFDTATLDRNLLEAFHDASQMDPANRDTHIRYAEAFFEVDNPDWQDALNQWTILSKGITDPLQLDLVHLQQARVLIQMGRLDQARKILATVERPSLQEARQKLEAEIATATAHAKP